MSLEMLSAIQLHSRRTRRTRPNSNLNNWVRELIPKDVPFSLRLCLKKELEHLLQFLRNTSDFRNYHPLGPDKPSLDVIVGVMQKLSSDAKHQKPTIIQVGSFTYHMFAFMFMVLTSYLQNEKRQTPQEDLQKVLFYAWAIGFSYWRITEPHKDESHTLPRSNPFTEERSIRAKTKFDKLSSDEKEGRNFILETFRWLSANSVSAPSTEKNKSAAASDSAAWSKQKPRRR